MFYTDTEMMQRTITIRMEKPPMKTATDSCTPPSSALLDRLDSVRMHSFDRKLAKRHLAHTELILDALFDLVRAGRATALAWRHHIFPPANQQRDAYFASAVDRSDLEQRIRNWERRPTPFQDGI